ncbi:MAG TPA: phospholipase D-like domain-containing protein [bacterium]|nr:phospholipase D-like domain-containing protein [bacterium]
MLQDFELIQTPWIDQFKDLIGETKSRLMFASPFIKKAAIKTIWDARKSNFSIVGLTSFKLRNFERGASDIEAFKDLLSIRDVTLKSLPRIHSKVYLFDSFAAIITSGNLTPGGLVRNLELGMLIREKRLIEDIGSYLETLRSDTSEAATITNDIVKDAESILENIQRPEPREIDYLDEMERDLFRADAVEDEVFQGGTDLILTGLSGWKKDVFECLNRIPKQTFSLEEVYGFELHLAKLHPENHTVKDKIRQQLQHLRDIGLVEFSTKGGTYRKLWV